MAIGIMSFNIMFKQAKIFRVEVKSDVPIRVISFDKDNTYWYAHPFNLNPLTTENLMLYFRERIFPENRGNAKEILRYLGISHYDPYLIVRKTHGVSISDFVWLQFDDEPVLDYEKIKIRDGHNSPSA